MKSRKITWAAVAVGAMALSGCGFHRIPVASVGVKFNAVSGVSQQVLKPEVVWVNPLFEQLITYPTAINNATFVLRSDEGDRSGDDSIRACTSEGAVLPVDVTVAYRIPAEPESVMRVFQHFGTRELREIQREHIRWATIVAINDVSGRKSLFDLLSKERAKFGPEVKAVLSTILEGWGFVVEDVLIREIHPQKEITEKIKEQQQQRADLEKARIDLQKARIEATTRLTEAQTRAEQNRLLGQQGDKVLQLKRLELRRRAIEKWDGHTPLISNGGIPFVEGKL